MGIICSVRTNTRSVGTGNRIDRRSDFFLTTESFQTALQLLHLPTRPHFLVIMMLVNPRVSLTKESD